MFRNLIRRQGRLGQNFLKVYPQRSQIRSITLSPTQIGVAKQYGFIINIIAGAYIGGLFVCLGSFYMLYADANERQHIPFEIGFSNGITAVKGINKDDVLKSPRHAVKHYRRLLLELSGTNEAELGENRYEIPLMDANVLVYEKSNDFANFYIDIVLRYARALLAKGELQTSMTMLQKIIDNDTIFFKVGDAERLAQCCRLLSKVCPDVDDKILYLKRSIEMMSQTYSSLKLDENYVIQENSRITDELLLTLNEMASNLAKSSNLNESLNIYLGNLKILTKLHHRLDEGTLLQSHYPMFNCDELNIILGECEIKAHISEILWAKGFKENAIAWSEEVVEQLYFNNSNSKRASPILYNVLTNLETMYESTKDVTSRRRCQRLKDELHVFEGEEQGWYESIVTRVSKIMYHKGPLGIIEKPLTERYGRPTKILELEEFEEEDVE